MWFGHLDHAPNPQSLRHLLRPGRDPFLGVVKDIAEDLGLASGDKRGRRVLGVRLTTGMRPGCQRVNRPSCFGLLPPLDCPR